MLPYIAFLSLCKFCLVPCFCIHSNPLIHLSSPLLCHNSKSEEFMTVTMVNTTLNIRMTCSHTHSVLRVNTFNICIGISLNPHPLGCCLTEPFSLPASFVFHLISSTPTNPQWKICSFYSVLFIYCKCTVTGQKCCIT